MKTIRIRKVVLLSFVAVSLFCGEAYSQSLRGPGVRVKRVKKEKTDRKKEKTSSSSVKQEDLRLPHAFKGLKEYRTWSVGANAGIIMPTTLTGGVSNYDNNTVKPAYGFNLRTQFNHYLGIQANVLFGGLSGNNDANSKNSTTSATLVGGDVQQYLSYETTLDFDWNLCLTYNLLTFDVLQKTHNAALFLSFGYGQTKYSATVTDKSNNIHPSKAISKTAGYIPIGLNMRFQVTDRLSADIGYSMRFVNATDLDGTTPLDNIQQDRYSYAHLGIEFSLGKAKNRNIDWVNPAAVMYEELKNLDLEKRVDSIEKRVGKLETMVDSLKLDTDNDGVGDFFDKEPDSEAGAKVDGSGRTKDSDLDGIPDHRDKCPTDSGLVEFNGCPDPNKKFVYSNVIVSPDAEGIDQIQTTKKNVDSKKKRKRGDMDTSLDDSESVIEPIKRSNKDELSSSENASSAKSSKKSSKIQKSLSDAVNEDGSEEELKSIKKGKKSKIKSDEAGSEPLSIVRFEFNSSVLQTVSYVVLDKLARELKSGRIPALLLGGHASEEGSEDYNMQLSIDRSNAIKSYMINAGVKTDKLIVKGYGETRPLNPGDSEEARSQNRRVEIIEMGQ